MHRLTSVRTQRIPSMGEGDPTPLFEATVAARGLDPRKLFERPQETDSCSCPWVGHQIYNIPGGEGGRSSRTHHS